MTSPDQRQLHVQGLTAADNGQLQKAIRLLEDALRIRPSSEIYVDLGQLWGKAERLDVARICFDKATTLDPSNAFALNNIGQCLVAERKTEDAIAFFEKAVLLAPDIPTFSNNLGQAYITNNQHIAARPIFQKLLKQEPGKASHHYHLGLIAEQVGDFSAARNAYRAALKTDADHASAMAGLFNIPGATAAVDVKAARQMLAKTQLSAMDRVKLRHAIGRHYEEAGRYDRAFAWHMAANEEQQKTLPAFNTEELSAAFATIMHTFTAENVSAWAVHGDPSDRPVFILGLPRSGTSLVEQIIASHHACEGAGELQAMPNAIDHVMADEPSQYDWTSLMRGDAAQQRIAAIARYYLDTTRKWNDDTSHHLTDKLPVNFLNIGVIAAALPNARIIHCSRDPRDVGISSLFHAFRLSYDYTLNEKDFVAYYRAYAMLMAHWRSILGPRIIDVDYEALVHAPEVQIRALLDSMGLPWDANCLNFYNNNRPVRTPSFWQVRQKINANSLGRWRHYADYMPELANLR
jgi:Flp pilus assembly protein TadD